MVAIVIISMLTLLLTMCGCSDNPNTEVKVKRTVILMDKLHAKTKIEKTSPSKDKSRNKKLAAPAVVDVVVTPDHIVEHIEEAGKDERGAPGGTIGEVEDH